MVKRRGGGSTGPACAACPDVVGMSPTAARKALEAAGYDVVVVGEGTAVLKSNPSAERDSSRA